jgi:hypothetical protein
MTKAMMTMRVPVLRRGLLLGLAVLCAMPGHAAAQGVEDIPWAGAAGVRVESYRFAEPGAVGLSSVTLTTVPLVAEAWVAGRARLTLAGGFAHATMQRDGGDEATVSGLTDTELRLAVPLAGEWLTLTGVAVLPTGKSRMTADELDVAAVVASDLLPFAISHWGTGGGGGASLSATRRFDGVGVGASAGYRASREYRAFDGDDTGYRPGDETFVRLAVDGTLGGARATLQAGAHHFSDDEFGGGGLYRSGNRYQLIGSLAFGGRGRADGVVYAGVLHREPGSRLATLAQDRAAQDLVLVGGGLRLPMPWGAVLPSADGRIFRSGDGVGQGLGVGAGASAEWATGGVTLVPSARLRLGRVVVLDGAESGFTGGELGLTLRRGRR